ncbi:unnamed protein product, partial [Aphanomyces euteiches]
MTRVELSYGVHGIANWSFIKIALHAQVIALQQAIFENEQFEKRYTHRFVASQLKLYKAGTKDGDKTTWLADDGNTENVLKGQIDKKYERMLPSCTLEEYFGADFQPLSKQIHVLVELPEASAGITSETPVTAQAQQISSIDDDDWTSEWLSEFRKSQIEPQDLPSLGKLAEFTK